MLSGSLFNKDERSVWYLPRKPTRLYMYDVIARAQDLSSKTKKPWYILIPSGHWRVVYGYLILAVITADLFTCAYSIVFCHGARTTNKTLVLLPFYLFDVLLKFCSAVPMNGGTLEVRASAIARRYFCSWRFWVDLVPLLPLEYAWEAQCWPENGGSCGLGYIISWQWVRLARWSVAWASCDRWRSVTTTANDGFLQVIKYVFLLLTVAHIATCIMFWAALGDSDPVCDHRSLELMPWANVSTTLKAHNALDPFNALLTDATTGRLKVPESLAEEKLLASQGADALLVFWQYAAAASLLGDAFGAKNYVGRVAVLFILVGGNVVFALVFGEVIMAMTNAKISQDTYARRMQVRAQ